MQHAWEDMKWIQNFIGKPEGKRLHGRPRSWWEGNIRTKLWEIVWKGVD